MVEMFVLKAFCKDRNTFNKYNSTVSSFNLDPEIKLLYNLIENYYESFQEHIYIGKDELTNWFKFNYSSYKDVDIIIKVIEDIFNIDISDSLIVDYLQASIEKNFASKIINTLIQVVDESKRGLLLSIENDLEKYKELIKINNKSDDIFVSTDIFKLVEQEANSTYPINWRLKCLRESCGPIKEGLYHVYARPNTGKSSFLAAEVTNFTRQLQGDDTLVWFNNEEQGDRVMKRMYSACLARPEADYMLEMERAKQYFYARGGERIKLYDNAFITIENINKFCIQYKPKIVVVDIADKVMFNGASSMDGPPRLKELYRRFRELSKQHKCAIITAGQASAEGHGKKWLEMTHMDYSKTAKAGELDISIGIGMSLDDGKEDMRYIHVNKNKFTGLHIKETVRIDSRTGRFYDLE